MLCAVYSVAFTTSIQYISHEQNTCTPTGQGKLEEVVEMLSQVVNRPYLRTPQTQIKEVARNVDHTCEEYLHEMKEVARAAAHHSLEIFKKKEPPPPRKPTPPPPPLATDPRYSLFSFSISIKTVHPYKC